MSSLRLNVFKYTGRTLINGKHVFLVGMDEEFFIVSVLKKAHF